MINRMEPPASRRGRLLLLFALLTAIACILLFLWSNLLPSALPTNWDRSVDDMSGRSTSDADSGSSQRISVKASHEILAVDDNGTPVASAAVRLPSGEEVLTDADGVANFHAVTGDALRVEKDGLLGVDLTWGREVSRRIVLQRQRVLTVQVCDEFRHPLQDVAVFAADWWYPDRDSLLKSGAPEAKSDSQGSATLRLTRLGNHYLHAYHPHWITNSKACRESMFVEFKGDSTVCIVMAPLQVVAFLPKGIDILKSSLTSRGPFDGAPTSRFERSVIDAAKRDIESRYPGSTAFILARTRLAPPTGDSRVECNLLIVPAGRVAQSRRVEMVNLDDFQGPFEFTCADTPASNAFGSVLVQSNSFPGAEVAGWRVLLEMGRDPNPDNPALRGYTQRIHFNELATVPEGRYRIHVLDNALMDMIAVKRGEIVVERGGMTTVSIGHNAPLIPVDLTIAMPDGGQCRDFQIRYSSVSIPGTCTEVITSPPQTLRRFLPEGSYSWQILMAGPSNYESYVGSGEFVITNTVVSAALPLVLQKG